MSKKLLHLTADRSVRPHTINGVSIVDEGVECQIGFDKYLIEVAGVDNKRRVKAAIEACVDAGIKFQQPDWAALIKPVKESESASASEEIEG